jgi:hypothetical protein
VLWEWEWEWQGQRLSKRSVGASAAGNFTTGAVHV